MKLLHRGSVKDLYQMDGGELCFEFSDRYSIFDWGEMPDHLEGKGEALALMATCFFEYYSKRGYADHFISQTSPKRLKVKAVDVLRPEFNETLGSYDYSAYKQRPVEALVPLEVIFRLGAPRGSSLLKRDPSLKEGQRFETPMVEFSTKLEKTDRLLTDEQAQDIAGLNKPELERLKNLTCRLARDLEDVLSQMQVELWDGKFEFAFSASDKASRDFMLVDSVGPDELRLTFRGVQLSKECLRQIYAPTPWKENIDRAKMKAHEQGLSDWKKICLEEFQSTPPALSKRQREVMSSMYTALARRLSFIVRGEDVFKDAPGLEDWVQSWKSLVETFEDRV